MSETETTDPISIRYLDSGRYVAASAAFLVVTTVCLVSSAEEDSIARPDVACEASPIGGVALHAGALCTAGSEVIVPQKTVLTGPGISYDPKAKSLVDSLPNASALIIEARAELLRAFPDGSISGFHVDWFTDPESTSDVPMVVVRVMTTADAAVASAALRDFDNKWWIDNLERSGGRLEFVAEFV